MFIILEDVEAVETIAASPAWCRQSVQASMPERIWQKSTLTPLCVILQILSVGPDTPCESRPGSREGALLTSSFPVLDSTVGG